MDFACIDYLFSILNSFLFLFLATSQPPPLPLPPPPLLGSFLRSAIHTTVCTQIIKNILQFAEANVFDQNSYHICEIFIFIFFSSFRWVIAIQHPMIAKKEEETRTNSQIHNHTDNTHTIQGTQLRHQDCLVLGMCAVRIIIMVHQLFVVVELWHVTSVYITRTHTHTDTIRTEKPCTRFTYNHCLRLSKLNQSYVFFNPKLLC